MKVWLVLLWLVTMLLYLVVCRETVSPARSSRTAEPEVTRKPSDESHVVRLLSAPFISFRHTWVTGTSTEREGSLHQSAQLVTLC